MKSSSGFDNILEALIQQKQVLEDMQAENASLRQQLADLRAGHGIFIEILGTRIPLATTSDAHVNDEVSEENAPAIDGIDVTAPVPAVAMEASAENDAWLLDTRVIELPEPDLALQETTMVAAAGSDLTLQPTASISSEAMQAAAEQAAPSPTDDFVIEDVSE